MIEIRERERSSLNKGRNETLAGAKLSYSAHVASNRGESWLPPYVMSLWILMTSIDKFSLQSIP